MKDIGRTNDGQYLVSMSSDEHRIFSELEAVIEGRDHSISFRGDYRLGNTIDLSDTLIFDLTISC